MMTPTSLLRVSLVLGGVLLLCALAGCRGLPIRSSQPVHRSSKHQSAPPSENRSATAIQTVTEYLTALEQRKFADAYELLSRDSQSKHDRAEFEEQSKREMPSFDLTTASTTITGDTALVQVQQTEDPATHGFTLVREDGAWKIVYWGGTPGAPYPKETS